MIFIIISAEDIFKKVRKILYIFNVVIDFGTNVIEQEIILPWSSSCQT